MNIKYLFKTAFLLTASVLVSCAGDDAANDITAPQEETQGMTEFAAAGNSDETGRASKTRTTGQYTGSSVKFYWTSNDPLWIKDGSSLKMSSRSDIPTTSGKETAAKFWFEGTYTATAYPVRYTGNGNTVGDKVTVKAAQAQQLPNDGAHIGTDGDCGTATATRGSDGKYSFTLDHKASYLTFMPYYSKGFDPSVKVTQIKVTADQPLAGTYDFDDTGILLSTATSTSQNCTLTLNGGGTDGFEIPVAADYTRNGAIMVVAPGSYTNFTVEYTLHDQVTNVTGTVSKNYGSITCDMGKNKKISQDLAITAYANQAYMWDATVGRPYWYGVTDIPLKEGQNKSGYPLSVSDARRFNTAGTFGNYGTRSAASCTTPNRYMWYAKRGEPHWDGELLWSMDKHLYKAGMWMKKAQYISGIRDDVTPDNIDLHTNGSAWSNPDAYLKGTVTQGRPGNNVIGQYFFLPAFGYYLNGTLYGRNSTGYYTSRMAMFISSGTYYTAMFFFEKTVIGLGINSRAMGTSNMPMQ